jgi:hypothetical protein
MASPTVYPPKRRRSLAGPFILIFLGVIFLLKNLGWGASWLHLLGHWWPLLLIILGAIKLYEYYAARRDGEYAEGVSGGTVVLIIFIIICGLTFTGIEKAKDNVNWGEVRDQFGVDDDVMGMLGHKAFSFDDETSKDLPAGATVKIISDRGSIAVNAWDENKIKVVAHKRVYAGNDQDAQNVNNSTKPTVEINGQTVTVSANTQGAGPKGVVSDMEVFVPRKVAVEIVAHKGDVNVSDRLADVHVEAGRGDVSLDQITGAVVTNMSHGSVHASKVTGNISADGRIDDLVAMDVMGSVTVNGDVFGELKLSKVSKGVVFHSSRTDFELAKLDGDLDMDRSDLRADNVIGPTTMNVRTKDVQLESVSGELRVQGENGDVTVQFAEKQPLGNVQVTTNKGSVRLTLPSKSGFQLEASTRNGNVSSDYPELGGNPDNEKNTSNVKGTVGKGNSKIVVSTDVGDIDIRKSTT